MNIFLWRSLCKILALIVFFLGVVGLTAAQTQELPKSTHDGLVLVENSEVKAAYMKPGATLETYKRVAIADVYVAFKKDWQRDFNRNVIGLGQRVSPNDMDRIKQRVADEFKRVLIKELERKGHDIVDVTGDDVLIIKPAIINLVVNAPDIAAGRGVTMVADAGEMTLYMEFYDSMTNDKIGIVIDPQLAGNPGAIIASRGSNQGAADILFKHWAKLLVSHLGVVQPSQSSQ